MVSFKKPVLPFTKGDADGTSKPSRRERRLKRLDFMPNWVRNEILAFLGEFVGTFMFLFMAFAATQVANAAAPPTEGSSLSQYPNSSNLLYISLAFGFSLAVNVWAFFRISGGLFNPAVSSNGAQNNRISLTQHRSHSVSTLLELSKPLAPSMSSSHNGSLVWLQQA
jgi:aquaporin related protein